MSSVSWHVDDDDDDFFFNSCLRILMSLLSTDPMDRNCHEMFAKNRELKIGGKQKVKNTTLKTVHMIDFNKLMSI
uniref:Uncharacterized protein n=1 Tax=Glossina palpalis gambiensis TaxID=67801 RepID=A0A1B0BVP7_9MUSC